MTFDELHHVIRRGDLAKLGAALDGGVDVNLRNRNGWTPLMLAACEGNSAIGKLLIDRGADLDARSQHPGSRMQYSALSLAIMSGKPSFVSLLLEHGAQLESPFASTFESFLDWCVQYSASSPAQMAHIRNILSSKASVETRTD